MKKIRTFSSRRTLIYPQSKIGLVIGKGADLPKEIIEKHQIEIISYKADWPEVEGLPGENIFQKMREAEKKEIKTFVKTSQPSPKVFLDAYKKQLEKFENVFCITLTSKLSGTYNSAIQAKNFLKPQEQERVFVVDSLNVSGGQALLAFRLFDLINEEEKTMKEIKKELEELRSKINCRVIFKDPKWVEAAGRMSPTIANWVRRMEKVGIRPLIGIKDGVLKPVGIKTGAKDIVIALFKEIKEKTRKLRNQNKKIRVIITHGDDVKAAQRLKDMIEKELEGGEVLFINILNDIIGTLGGPDALILSWIEG
ncbi:MAG: DegV family protein [Candidatus Nealsonbacteria bacterium]